MKPEPLKGKTQSHCHRKDLTDRHDIHDDKDIQSAVKWLREEDRKVLIDRMNKKITHAQVITRLLRNKRKAFEDILPLIQKERGK